MPLPALPYLKGCPDWVPPSKAVMTVPRVILRVHKCKQCAQKYWIMARIREEMAVTRRFAVTKNRALAKYTNYTKYI